jgi:hypothetical protein
VKGAEQRPLSFNRSWLGRNIPATIRSRVLLPDPLEPMMPNVSPSAMEMLTS